MFRLDDEIFNHLSETFPEMVKEPYEGLKKLDENMMKSDKGKKSWRGFIAS
jgi:hypothetical protein